jgi:hypothetical protein
VQDFTGHAIECDDRAMDFAESIAWKIEKGYREPLPGSVLRLTATPVHSAQEALNLALQVFAIRFGQAHRYIEGRFSEGAAFDVLEPDASSFDFQIGILSVMTGTKLLSS